MKPQHYIIYIYIHVRLHAQVEHRLQRNAELHGLLRSLQRWQSQISQLLGRSIYIYAYIYIHRDAQIREKTSVGAGQGFRRLRSEHIYIYVCIYVSYMHILYKKKLYIYIHDVYCRGVIGAWMVLTGQWKPSEVEPRLHCWCQIYR